MTRGHLLEVRAVHRETPGDGTAAFGAKLVNVRVDPPVGRAVSKVWLEERAVGLIKLTRLNDELGDGMLVRFEEGLGKAREARRGLGIGQGELVEGLGDAGRRPDIDLLAGE